MFLSWGNLGAVFPSNVWSSFQDKFLILGADNIRGGFTVRPNDNRNKCLPENLKQAILQELLNQLNKKEGKDCTSKEGKFELRKSQSVMLEFSFS